MLLRKSKKYLIIALSILMILSCSTSALAAPTSIKPVTVYTNNFNGQFMLPYLESPDLVDLRINGMWQSTSDYQYQSFNLYATKGGLFIDKALELGVNIFINEKKGIITVKDTVVDINEIISYYPYETKVVGVETLNIEIKYNIKEPFIIDYSKQTNYFDEELGLYVLNNTVDYKLWKSSFSPMTFTGYIFGESRQYTLTHEYTEFEIVHESILYKQPPIIIE